MEYRVIRANDYLAHYGVKGMKWRIRQSYDRSGPGYDPGTGVHTIGKRVTTGLGTAKATKKVKTTKTKTAKAAKATKASKKEIKKTSDAGKKAVDAIVSKTTKKTKPDETEPAKKKVKVRQTTPYMRRYQKKKQEEKKKAALKTAKKTDKGRYVV